MKITEAVDKYNAAEQELIIEAYEREGGDTEDVDLILLDRICARLGLGLDNDDIDNDDIAEGSIEHIVTFYPFVDVKRITAFHDKLIITI